MSSATNRKRYDTQFKRDAVKLVLEGRRSCRAVEADLGLGSGMLYRWVRQYRSDPDQSFPGNGRLRAHDEEVRQLRREVDVLRAERDILKKALAIFSKGPARPTRS